MPRLISPSQIGWSQCRQSSRTILSHRPLMLVEEDSDRTGIQVETEDHPLQPVNLMFVPSSPLMSVSLMQMA